MEEKRTEAAIRAAVEAILFAAGGSVEASRLAAALELETGEMEDILRRMELRYEEEDRGNPPAGAGGRLAALHETGALRRADPRGQAAEESIR